MSVYQQPPWALWLDMNTRDDVTRPGWQAARMVSDEERAAIGNEVAAARQHYGWAKEAASRAAGVDSQTWTRIEKGERVRPDKLAAVRLYVQSQTAASPLDLDAISDEALINELARRLALHRGEAASDGPPMNRPVVREVPTTGQYAVAVTTEQERRKSKRGPQRTSEESHPNGG